MAAVVGRPGIVATWQAIFEKGQIEAISQKDILYQFAFHSLLPACQVATIPPPPP